MLITDQFVVLNFPKTGSTFVRKVLKKIYKNRRYSLRDQVCFKLGFKKRPLFQELFHPNHWLKGYNIVDQHGTWQQIPPEHRHKTVVSVLRNPLDRYVSTYEFGHWRNHPPAVLKVIQERYPHFPKLKFEEYVYYINWIHTIYLGGRGLKADVGQQSLQFLRFFSKDPAKAYEELTDKDIADGSWLKHLAAVTFLKSENLNVELHDFLIANGYSPAEVGFIRSEQRIFPPGSRRGNADWREYYSDDLTRYVREKEKILFDLYDGKPASLLWWSSTRGISSSVSHLASPREMSVSQSGAAAARPVT